MLKAQILNAHQAFLSMRAQFLMKQSQSRFFEFGWRVEEISERDSTVKNKIVPRHKQTQLHNDLPSQIHCANLQVGLLTETFTQNGFG